jgi:hypothetical protein
MNLAEVSRSCRSELWIGYLKKEENSNTFFSNYFRNISVQFHSVLYHVFILTFDYFAWNCEVGTLLNFRGNMIYNYVSPFLTFVKKFHMCCNSFSAHVNNISCVGMVCFAVLLLKLAEIYMKAF